MNLRQRRTLSDDHEPGGVTTTAGAPGNEGEGTTAGERGKPGATPSRCPAELITYPHPSRPTTQPASATLSEAVL